MMRKHLLERKARLKAAENHKVPKDGVIELAVVLPELMTHGNV